MDKASSNNWVWSGMAFVLTYAGVAVALWPTSLSFVETWSGGETYNHGFAILPISLWLVWEKRKELAKVSPRPDLRLLALVLIPAVGWLLGALSGVRLFEQLGMVGILIATSVALLGWRLGVYLAFPLLFLIFAVPMGEELIPPMMEYTATFTVEAVRLSGIPVYQDGLWFQLPTTRWSVVEACSGVRYIIASVTLGFLYAYVSYHTLWKRIAFIILSAIVPVIANGLRAYMIVMIGHTTDGELAAGVDHLIYGWVFFGVVMLVLFWIGGYWQEKHPALEVEADSDRRSAPGISRHLLVAVLGIALALGTSAIAKVALQPNVLATDSLQVPEQIAGWKLQVNVNSDLRPTALETDYVLDAVYAGDKGKVSVYVGFYPNQSQGAEAVAARNAVVGDDRGRQQVESLMPIGVGNFEVNRLQLIRQYLGGRDSLLVWQWHRIGGVEVRGRYRSKVQEVMSRLGAQRGDGAWIAMAVPAEDHNLAESEAALRAFVEEAYPAIAAAMDAVLGVER